jgi:alkanesulfonate monooxygenase SsuD/methylene tetrahydromethanopterin reductase-like flavin-dependent oxidoreductase (luciferase family)
MGELVTPDILKEFAIIGEPETIPSQMKARYGDLVDRTSAAYANIPKDKRLAIIRELSS